MPIRRSGIRWLREDGSFCRAGEVIAFCNVGLAAVGAAPKSDEPFAEEWLDLQVALAPRVAGRIHRAESSSRGGFLDQLDHFQLWIPDNVIGSLERADNAGPARPGEEGELELLMLAGRRYADLTEGRQGLLSGWHDRSRAWRVNGDEPLGAVLGLGICEMIGVMRGDSLAFLELFEAISGPAHVAYAADAPVLSCVRFVIEQTARTEAEYQEIADDIVAYFARAPTSPAEWVFVGALLDGIRRAPLRETYDILSRSGLRRSGPADAVVLSAAAEQNIIHRHRRLGYTLTVHDFRAHRAGPTVRAWIKDDFERVNRSLDDIARDYGQLADLLRNGSGALPRHVLVLNKMSSSGDDDAQDYSIFDAPLGDLLSSIYAKDINLMLHDVAHQSDIAIIDVDAIAADMGGQRNLPDGIHANGALQNELRGEMLHILHGRGVPGFGPAFG